MVRGSFDRHPVQIGEFVECHFVAEAPVRRRGWRRSADSARLYAISLLSGNLTGNFASFGHLETVLAQEPAVLQPLIEQFPTRINMEIISGNRDF
jgi:hypothetical protein